MIKFKQINEICENIKEIKRAPSKNHYFEECRFNLNLNKDIFQVAEERKPDCQRYRHVKQDNVLQRELISGFAT